MNRNRTVAQLNEALFPRGLPRGGLRRRGWSLSCAAQHCMQPTGPVGLRSVSTFAFEVGLVVDALLQTPARRLMLTVEAVEKGDREPSPSSQLFVCSIGSCSGPALLVPGHFWPSALYFRSPCTASFPMLCTRQNSFHWVSTLTLPRWLNRSRPRLLRMLANTGSTVPIRRL